VADLPAEAVVPDGVIDPTRNGRDAAPRDRGHLRLVK
jgi:hypothetical protein